MVPGLEGRYGGMEKSEMTEKLVEGVLGGSQTHTLLMMRMPRQLRRARRLRRGWKLETLAIPAVVEAMIFISIMSLSERIRNDRAHFGFSVLCHV